MVLKKELVIYLKEKVSKKISVFNNNEAQNLMSRALSLMGHIQS